MFQNAFVSVVIPAAGVGSRMNAKQKKQYIEVNGREVLEWTVTRLAQSTVIDEWIIVVGMDEVALLTSKMARWLPGQSVKVLAGGAARHDSVFIGLQNCDAASKYVFIHDGVRPFVQGDWLEGMLLKMVDEALDGVALGNPVIDTVKRAAKDGLIYGHEDRETLWAIETPQLFRTRDIYALHAQKAQGSEASNITDDTQLMMQQGKTVKIMSHEGINMKLTTPTELTIAKALLGIERTI